MFDFHEKRKLRRFLYSYFVIFVLFVGTLYVGEAAYTRYTVAEDMKHKLDEKRAELAYLEDRAEKLESEIVYLQDDRGIEAELRTRFDVAKEGEAVVILVRDDASEDPVIATPPQQATSTPSFWETLIFW